MGSAGSSWDASFLNHPIFDSHTFVSNSNYPSASSCDWNEETSPPPVINTEASDKGSKVYGEVFPNSDSSDSSDSDDESDDDGDDDESDMDSEDPTYQPSTDAEGGADDGLEIEGGAPDVIDITSDEDSIVGSNFG